MVGSGFVLGCCDYLLYVCSVSSGIYLSPLCKGSYSSRICVMVNCFDLLGCYRDLLDLLWTVTGADMYLLLSQCEYFSFQRSLLFVV